MLICKKYIFRFILKFGKQCTHFLNKKAAYHFLVVQKDYANFQLQL